MKRFISAFCFTFFLAFPLLADEAHAIEGATPETLLGGAENLKIVTSAKEVVVFRVADDTGKPEDHRTVAMDGLKCDASNTITGPVLQKVVASFSDVTNFGVEYLCDFDPAIIMRFKTDAGTVDIVVCFGCGEMQVFRDGRIVHRPFQFAASQNSFHKAAHTAFVALARKAFPDDPIIQSLHLPKSDTGDVPEKQSP